MTEGSNQGLITVVAMIIFGIFVAISYLLFQGKLNIGLSEVFIDRLEQAQDLLNNTFNVKSEREDEKYLYAKIREANPEKNETEIWVQAEKLENNTLRLHQSSIKDSNYGGGSIEMTGDLFLPDKIDGKKIIGLGDSNVITSGGWFSNNLFANALFNGELQLPTSLEYISYAVFEKSTFKGELSLPNSLNQIGLRAFLNSNFTDKLILPMNLSIIGDYAFYNSFFTGKLNLPDNLNFINYRVFSKSKFTDTLDITNINYIQSSAFSNSKFNNVINDNIGIADESEGLYPTKGIHERAIRMSDGRYYSGKN